MKKTFLIFILILILMQKFFLFSDVYDIEKVQIPFNEEMSDVSLFTFKLSLEELQLILLELTKPFPLPPEKVNLSDSKTENKNIPLNTLKKNLPELTKPFPLIHETAEFFPDSEPNFNEINLHNIRLQVKSLEASYTEVSEFFFDNDINDWVLIVNEKKFLWADGKILPEEKIIDKKKYAPFFGYFYLKDLFEVSDKDVEYFRNYFSKELQHFIIEDSLKSNLFFLSEIYGEISKKAITEKLEPVYVFGQAVYVHKRISSNFKKVVKQIINLKKSGTLKKFFANYANTYGFNWRQIEYKNAISNHSLGIAVDIMAKYYGDLNAFWYWESTVNDSWFLLKINERWHPPPEIVRAFEKNGFTWGGYWTYWDTMHFEFKPELIYICDFACDANERFFTEVELEKIEPAKESISESSSESGE